MYITCNTHTHTQTHTHIHIHMHMQIRRSTDRLTAYVLDNLPDRLLDGWMERQTRLDFIRPLDGTTLD